MSDELTGLRALVTGASGGIGLAIAKELHRRGAKLVLTARRKDRLDALAATLGGADVIVADLGTPGAAETLWAQVGHVDVLVNNAGFGYFRRFDAAEWSRDAELLQLNIVSLVELSRRFVDQHSASLRDAARSGKAGPFDHAKGRRGYILNIASIAAYQSVPQFAVYAASKAFVRNFSEALHDELAGSELSATVICPGGTHTEFHAAAGAGDYGWLANASMLSAEIVADIGVRAMLARRRTVVPGVLNKLSCFGVRLVPRRFASWMATRVLGKPRAALPARTPS